MRVVRPKTNDIVDPSHKRWIEDLYKLTNRNISFGTEVDGVDQNIDGKMVEILNTGTANTEVAIAHNLLRVPQYIDFKYKNIAGDWYASTTAWTETKVFVKFTTANMHVRLFIH